MDRGNDKVCSGVLLVVEQVVQTYDDKTSHREKKDQPGILGTKQGDKRHTVIKGGTAKPHHKADDNGKNDPLHGNDPAVQVVFDFVFDYIIHVFYLSCFLLK
jgi:hypothetical protein